MWQIDSSLGRDFALTERFKLQFRGEVYNVLNHPNFANVSANLGFYSPQYGNFPYDPAQFGRPWSMLGVGGGGGSAGIIPLFSTGGPRSVQLALKLVF
jgi:hypothetical protein